MLAGNVCSLFAVLITMKMAAVAGLVGILVIFLQVAICQREIFSFVRRALKRLMAETSLCIWTHYQVSSVNQLNRRTAGGLVHKGAYMQSLYMLDQHCTMGFYRNCKNIQICMKENPTDNLVFNCPEEVPETTLPLSPFPNFSGKSHSLS